MSKIQMHNGLNQLFTNLGEKIRLKRSQLGMTQSDLAQKARINRTYICEIERGHRNISIMTLYSLAEALGLETSELFEVPAQAPEQQPELQLVRAQAPAHHDHEQNLVRAQAHNQPEYNQKFVTAKARANKQQYDADLLNTELLDVTSGLSNPLNK